MFDLESNTDVMKEYLKFLTKYGRTYASKEDHVGRYSTFKANY